MKNTLVLFYFLVIYAIVQLLWWGYMWFSLEPNRKGMIIGEGMIFLLIFLVGAIKLKNHFQKEKEAQKQQENFLLAITHELKSPLAAVKLNIETILRRDLEKEKQSLLLDNSLKDVERLDDLVENILLVTKLESKTFNLPKEEFDFTALLENIAARLQEHACSSQVIKTELRPGVYLNADKFAISIVATNLIENAIKYSPPCAHVNVSLHEKEGQLIFSVADHGQGIALEEKKLIFNKFYRVGNEATRTKKGTGLGLFVVKTVLQRHNAQIKVKDNTPSGSIFEVTFDNNHYATS